MVHIVECGECGAKNRIKRHSVRFRPVCGRCGKSLVYSSRPSVWARTMWNFVLLAAIAGVAYGIVIIPSLLTKDFSVLEANENSKTNDYREQEQKKHLGIESKLKAELAQVDPARLHREALAYYQAIFEARKSYDKRYALTPREKAQLRMQEIASDSAKSYREVIQAVAVEASPEGSDVRVVETLQGMTLHIDFDMSSLTSGEYGTRTKHTTKESLKKEVIILISKVTNDVFHFCRDLDLQAIYVGCRHYVDTHYQDGSRRDINTVLYKICIRNKEIDELSNNPFLDVYSTTRHFEVEEDNFANIRIVITQL